MIGAWEIALSRMWGSPAVSRSERNVVHPPNTADFRQSPATCSRARPRIVPDWEISALKLGREGRLRAKLIAISGIIGQFGPDCGGAAPRFLRCNGNLEELDVRDLRITR